MLAKGIIKEILSPCVILPLLILKKDGSMRMCVDSRTINKITIKYEYPIPKLEDFLDKLHGVTISSKIGLRSRYRQIKIFEGDE